MFPMPTILKDFLLILFFQGVNRLFVLAFDNTNNASKVEKNSQRKYFMTAFMTSQLVIKLGNMMKLERLQQEKGTTIRC